MSQDEPGLTDIDIITFNNLPPTALINNGDALQALAGSALEGATTELVNSAEGQQLLAKVVTCAIRVGDTVHFPRPDGSSLTLTGQLAIA
ncbi:MAG TPA: hypothetical protein VEL05_08150, partial [Candidatus Acidoferrum sp.]|nr:hypothetical protein [Candidatus Acidoferrum sp.]